MELKDYIRLVEKANQPTDEKALSEAFEEIAKLFSAKEHSDTWENYIDETTEYITKGGREYGHLMTYLRGIRALKAYAALAENPVYTLALGDEFFWMATDLPAYEDDKDEPTTRRAFYIGATKQVADLFLEDVKEDFRANDAEDEVESLRVVRVPLFAIAECAAELYEDDVDEIEADEVDTGEPLEPIYLLHRDGEEPGTWMMDPIPGAFLDSDLPTIAVGAVNHSASDAVYFAATDYTDFDPGFVDDFDYSDLDDEYEEEDEDDDEGWNEIRNALDELSSRSSDRPVNPGFDFVIEDGGAKKD